MLNGSIQRAKNAKTALVRFFCASPRCLAKYLINGLVIVIPLAVTVWVIVWFFDLVDGLLAPIIRWGFGRPIPGLGFAIIVVITVIVGYFAIRVGHPRVFQYLERTLKKIPVAGAIYDGARQIMLSFTNRGSKKFLEVVFMEFPRKGIYTVGFVTGTTTVRGEKMLNVFIPTAPTPFSGFLQIVPAADVVPSSISVNDAMKLIISAGGFSPGEIAETILKDVPAAAAAMPANNQNLERL
jgi:uncharacterized membrane protein